MGFGFCKWMDCKLIVSTKLTNVHRQSSNIFLFLWFGFATHIPSLFIKMLPLFLPEFGIQDGWKNSIPNVRGKLKAPVVIEADLHYLVVCNIKKKDGSSKCTLANMQWQIFHPKNFMFDPSTNAYSLICTLQTASQCQLWKRDKNNERDLIEVPYYTIFTLPKFFEKSVSLACELWRSASFDVTKGTNTLLIPLQG